VEAEKTAKEEEKIATEEVVEVKHKEADAEKEVAQA
jgi:hypothetical protein